MKILSLAGTLELCFAAAATAQTTTIVLTPEQVKWAPAKDLPAGWEAAVLAGDPSKPGR